MANRAHDVKNYYHIGTIPDANQNVYVYDLRMIVTANKNGFCPVSMNSRRARKPLIKNLNSNETMNYQNDDDPLFSSWDMLGTNLSIKIDTHMWDTEAGMNTNLNEM